MEKESKLKRESIMIAMSKYFLDYLKVKSLSSRLSSEEITAKTATDHKRDEECSAVVWAAASAVKGISFGIKVNPLREE
jgi:molybdate-binding protein